MNLLVRRGGRLLGETADLISRVIGCVVSRVGDRPGVLAAAFVVAPVTALAALTAVLLMASAAWLPAALGKDACSRRFKVSALSSAVAVSPRQPRSWPHHRPDRPG